MGETESGRAGKERRDRQRVKKTIWMGNGKPELSPGTKNVYAWPCLCPANPKGDKTGKRNTEKGAGGGTVFSVGGITGPKQAG